MKRVRHFLNFGIRSLLVLMLLAGCGGGGNGGGGFAGIEGTGVVSGFGSIIVNGIEFDVASADILFNGEPATEEDLRVGDVVTLRGRIEEDGNAFADTVVFDRWMDGPISTVALEDGVGEIVALDQNVRVSADTQFINTSAETLVAGDLIAVSGLVGDGGVIEATSIEQGPEYVPGSTRIDVEGTVENLDVDSFELAGLTVTFGNAEILETAGSLADGAYVQVFGTQTAADDAPLDADTVEVRSRAGSGSVERFFVQGLIGEFNDATNFEVNGQPVQVTADADVDVDAAALGLGAAVTVDGELRDGVLLADSVATQSVRALTLRAPIGSLRVSAGGMSLLGVDAQLRADTRYRDRSAQDDRLLGSGRLRRGDNVEVTGFFDSGVLQITRLERRNPAPDGFARVRGPIGQIQRNGRAGALTIAGVTVRTVDGTTSYVSTSGEALNAADFFAAAAAAGANVIATGPGNADEINVATEIRFLGAGLGQ